MGTAIEQDLGEPRGAPPINETGGEQPPPKYGPLLDEPDEEKAFRMALKLWKQNERQHKRLAAKWKQNKYWRDGHRHVKVVEDTDRNEIRLVMPLGAASLPPVPNACNYKIRGAIAVMLADPPRPECEPWDDTPQAREAAQFATRLLEMESGESGLNTDAVFASALDIAGTYASSFTWVGYDPKGGGLQPKAVLAHPDATNIAEAETGPPGAPPKSAVSRFEMPDGSLSKTSRGAVREWVPKLRPVNLNGNNVRLLPRNATGIDDANGVIIGTWHTLGQLKAMYPRVEAMTPDQQGELIAYRVEEWKRLLPEGLEADDTTKHMEGANPRDDALVLVFHVYFKSNAEYPYGAYCCFAGAKYRLEKRPWYATTPDAQGDEQDEMLDLPIAQFRWWADAQGGNPYGMAPAQALGPMDEMRATQYGAALEYLYRFSRPRPYLPMGTTVQPEDLADLDKPIYVPPGGKPEFPPIPEFPQMGMQLVDRIDKEMDNELSLHDQARGMTAGSVRSAEQQKVIIEQSLAGTAVVRAAAEDYYERLHRIILQQTRAWIKTPQLMRYQGDGGAFMVEEWTNARLGATRTVRVRRNTFTLMAPTARDGLIIEKMQAGLIPPEEGQRLYRENMAPGLAVREDPAVERIKRHLHLWRKGPTPAMLEQAQMAAANPAPPQVDPMTGQPVPPPDPLAVAAEQLFAPLPVDDEQPIALKRHLELSRAVSDAETTGFPPGWIQGLVNVYLRNRQAAGILTVAEQQQMQMQQAQQQQQAQAQQAEQGRTEASANRQAASETEAIKQAGATERERIKAGAQAAGAP